MEASSCLVVFLQQDSTYKLHVVHVYKNFNMKDDSSGGTGKLCLTISVWSTKPTYAYGNTIVLPVRKLWSNTLLIKHTSFPNYNIFFIIFRKRAKVQEPLVCVLLEIFGPNRVNTILSGHFGAPGMRNVTSILFYNFMYYLMEILKN